MYKAVESAFFLSDSSWKEFSHLARKMCAFSQKGCFSYTRV